MNIVSERERILRSLGVTLCMVLSGFPRMAAAQTMDDDDLLLTIPAIVAKKGDRPVPNTQFAINSGTAKFTPDTTEQTLIDRGVANVNLNGLRIYIGTQQVSPINQNPIVRAFGANDGWLRTDMEATGADGRGVSLFVNGADLYASFTVDGTQGQASQDFRRASQGATPSWLRSYGAGGGPKVSVLAKLNPQNGDLISAVYVSAVLSSGRSNSLSLNAISRKANGNIEIGAKSFFSPRAVNGNALPRQGSGDSPFDYFLELTPDLRQAVSARSPDF